MSSGSSEKMHERIGESSVLIWLLLRVNRWALTAAILAVVFVALGATSRLDLSPLHAVVATHDAVHWMFSAFIGAIITGTSIVVTINQLVLSQELGAVGDQRERMSESIEFRQDTEETIGEDVVPPEPSAFLGTLVDGIEKRAEELEETVAEERDEELKEEIGNYVEDLNDNAETVQENLEGAQFGTFDVIWSALNFNYSWKIYDARRIRHEYGESLSEETDEAIDEMIEALEFFGPAREHFKTLYFQWELINLSRALLYAAVPALTVTGVMLMYVDGDAVGGATLGVSNLAWLVSAGFVVGLTPFIVFIVYVLRIATVAKRTLAMGPFILRETEREEDVEA